MKRLVAILAVICLALGVTLILVLGRSEPDPETERWKEEAAAHQADADYWREVASEERAARLADSIRSDSIIRAQRAASRASEAETDEGVASLDERAQAIVRPLLEAERSQHRAEVAAIEEAHDRALTLIRAELDATKNEAADLRETITAHENTIDRLEERLAPSFSLFGFGIDLKCVGGIGASYDAVPRDDDERRLSAGPSVTCGVAL